MTSAACSCTARSCTRPEYALTPHAMASPWSSLGNEPSQLAAMSSTVGWEPHVAQISTRSRHHTGRDVAAQCWVFFSLPSRQSIHLPNALSCCLHVKVDVPGSTHGLCRWEWILPQHNQRFVRML